MTPVDAEVSQTVVSNASPGSTELPILPDSVCATEGTFGQFELLRELGHGGGGHVFLASQSDLGSRLVVLKFIPHELSEHLSLARLQHTNIVPLFGVYDDPVESRRALCMPFFGTTTLGHVLDALDPVAPEQRHGRNLVAVVEQRERDLPHAAAKDGPARKFLQETDYARAVCWIGACLADALEYAHQRGLLHLDLKPSNVLLASDGQPMLLDFHLASPPFHVGDDPPEYFGGTPTYMSPEQRTACDDVTCARPISRDVDGRADIYSLGMLLFVHLAGVEPGAKQRSAEALRRFNPAVSVGLADILARCTAAEPRDRYQTAAALARDLRRHLQDEPLRGVANRSWAESWQKWRRRKPNALVTLGLMVTLPAALLVCSILAYRTVSRHQELADTYFHDGRQQMRQGQYRQAAETFTRGIDEASAFGVRADLRQSLQRELPIAQRACSAQELHELTEEIRALTLSQTLDVRALVVVAVHCRKIWDQRQALTDSDSALLDPALELRVRHDLAELALGWSEVHVQLGPPHQEAERRQFIGDLLDECRAFSPSPIVLDWYRQVHVDKTRAAPVFEHAFRQARSSWEFYRLGRLLLRAGAYERAALALEESLAQEPADYWANFSLGTCAARLGQPERAAAAFGVCIGLQPQGEAAYLRRGQAWAELGKWKAALGDFDRALAYRPNQTELILQRGQARFHLGDLALAQEDLLQALEQGAEAAHVNPMLDRIEKSLRARRLAAPAAEPGGGS